MVRMRSPSRWSAQMLKAAALACLLAGCAVSLAAPGGEASMRDTKLQKVAYKPADGKKTAGRKKAATGKPVRKAAAGEPLARDTVTLNFVDASIASVVKAMSDMSGKAIVVDPRVKGTLQVTSPRPVSPRTAYEILLASLRMQGYASVETDGVVRIVPESEAKFYSTPVAVARKASARGETVRGEVETRVFDLKHESATQMLPALRSLAGANSVMHADAVSNTLIVTDYAGNLDRLGQIIDNLDMQSADEPVLIPVRHANAQDIANQIGKLYRLSVAGGGNAAAAPGTEGERLDVAVDSRSNSLILRSRNRSLVSRVQNMVASLDTQTSVAGNFHVIYLKNAEATKVAETLRKILAGDGGANASAAAPSSSGIRLPGAESTQGGPGMIQADAASNALIITASEAVFNNIKAVVEKLDVRRAQVLVEALIAEVSAEKASELGIQWFDASGGRAGTTGNRFFGGFGNSSSTSNIATIAANPLNAAQGLSIGVVKGQLTLPGNINILNLGALARALQTQADANILSTPTLMTLDNEEAKISVGSNVPFSTGQYNVSGTATPFQTIERKDVGLTLKVKPQISEGGTVRMQIYQEVSKLRQQTDNVTLATTDKRSIESMVLVDDGQIVVLGGLIEDQVQNVEDKVPVLGDVPVLGNLFRYNTRKIAKTNLMVFLRPQVVRDGRTAAMVTHPRYEYILGQQKSIVLDEQPQVPAEMGASRMTPDLPPGKSPAPSR